MICSNHSLSETRMMKIKKMARMRANEVVRITDKEDGTDGAK